MNSLKGTMGNSPSGLLRKPADCIAAISVPIL
jgi:hypothetical protein